MLSKFSSVLVLAVLASSAAFAQTNPPAGGGPHEGPCKKIVEACKGAGFIQGDWKKGDGLWRDCVDPIIQGATTVPGATKSLPKVSADDIAACKAKRPKFGSGKVGS